ncbi:hypothetical protein THASP1DRAFT_28576 [Thamnocephalis sphaerospora]|uniref:Phospholipid/glycerol acyltransferase domain-containing protein n=1 Tax=Thamnocephalis sphaerospora TaxID=78915 RepID=A0A4P9XTW8_9FUNG|nr:hypothetical protein THASP1DRAFT_28576 [Thamnocephalis sphaerospora]|eukprot:RKP09633.1 hypothetical protein THASP1DRAFT_28576 [Thamnocephalis sphaerospora]
MEKFSRWRDAGTGIHPFLHPVPPRADRSGLAMANKVLKDYLLGPVLAIARFILLAADALIWLAAEALCLLVQLVFPVLQRPLRRLLVGLCARLALLIVGVHWIKVDTATLRRGLKKNDGSVRSGDIIVANSAGYLDILYFAFRFAPTFTRVYGDRVVPVTVWQMLCGCVRAEMEPPEDAMPLKTLVHRAQQQRLGPIVVLPEATTSNGRALLRFSPVFRNFDPEAAHAHIHIIGFKYPYEHYCPTYALGNPYSHLFRLCCQYNNAMTVRYLSPSECPTTATPEPREGQSPTDDPLGEEIAVLLGQMARLRRTQLGVADKREFLEYYAHRSSGQVRKR